MGWKWNFVDSKVSFYTWMKLKGTKISLAVYFELKFILMWDWKIKIPLIFFKLSQAHIVGTSHHFRLKHWKYYRAVLWPLLCNPLRIYFVAMHDSYEFSPKKHILINFIPLNVLLDVFSLFWVVQINNAPITDSRFE